MISARVRFMLMALLAVLTLGFTSLRAEEPQSKSGSELARVEFGAGHWTVTAPVQYYNSKGGCWIFAATCKSEPGGKRVRFQPFALISRTRDGEPVTILAEDVYMDFDQPIDRAANPDGLRAAIEAANARLSEAVARGDASAAAAAYTDDGELLPPNQEPIKGKKGIEGFYRAAIAAGAKGMTLETVEADGAGDLAFETGRFKIVGNGGKLLEAGKYIVVWKRAAGAWRLHRDIWNSSTPLSSIIDSPQPIRSSPR